MSYSTYKFIHLIGIIFIFICIGGLSALPQGSKSKKFFGMIHGITLIVVFVAGFGLMARLKLDFPWPAWVWLKMLGWLLVGMAPKFVKSWTPIKALLFYGLLGAAIAYLALFKPF